MLIWQPEISVRSRGPRTGRHQLRLSIADAVGEKVPHRTAADPQPDQTQCFDSKPVIKIVCAAGSSWLLWGEKRAGAYPEVHILIMRFCEFGASPANGPSKS